MLTIYCLYGASFVCCLAVNLITGKYQDATLGQKITMKVISLLPIITTNQFMLFNFEFFEYYHLLLFFKRLGYLTRRDGYHRRVQRHRYG